jgi:hypothetical protein
MEAQTVWICTIVPLLLPQEKEMEEEAKSRIELPNPSLRSGQATATIHDG